MKVIELKIKKGGDIAQQIGDAVAAAIAQDRETSDEGSSPTEADSLDRNGLRKMAETEEFKKFRNNVTERTNELIELISANEPKYGCSIVVGITFAFGKESNIGQAAVCGRGDSVRASLERINELHDIGDIMKHIVLSPILPH